MISFNEYLEEYKSDKEKLHAFLFNEITDLEFAIYDKFEDVFMNINIKDEAIYAIMDYIFEKYIFPNKKIVNLGLQCIDAEDKIKSGKFSDYECDTTLTHKQEIALTEFRYIMGLVIDFALENLSSIPDSLKMQIIKKDPKITGIFKTLSLSVQQFIADNYPLQVPLIKNLDPKLKEIYNNTIKASEAGFF